MVSHVTCHLLLDGHGGVVINWGEGLALMLLKNSVANRHTEYELQGDRIALRIGNFHRMKGFFA